MSITLGDEKINPCQWHEADDGNEKCFETKTIMLKVKQADGSTAELGYLCPSHGFEWMRTHITNITDEEAPLVQDHLRDLADIAALHGEDVDMTIDPEV